MQFWDMNSEAYTEPDPPETRSFLFPFLDSFEVGLSYSHRT